LQNYLFSNNKSKIMAVTTFSEQDMYPSVQSNLRASYPLSDGWEIIYQHRGANGSYIPDFVVQRTYRKIIEKVVVEVKKCKITSADIAQINSYASKLAGPNVKIIQKILVVASGADTSLVKAGDFKLMILKGFACPQKKLLSREQVGILYKK
jgi:hypothetical protein